ncbi:hypothetical protein [Pengzhenrongella sp.]|uniref:hypothetical protein n=1 Tax=Pengzhenrongella sp. TaxID=2888820 RepID=UPI002F91E408
MFSIAGTDQGYMAAVRKTVLDVVAVASVVTARLVELSVEVGVGVGVGVGSVTAVSVGESNVHFPLVGADTLREETSPARMDGDVEAGAAVAGEAGPEMTRPQQATTRPAVHRPLGAVVLVADLPDVKMRGLPAR